MSEAEKILYWLADCEAATLEHISRLKSASRSEIRRHKEICERLQVMLTVGSFSGVLRKQEIVIDRLNDAVESAERREPKAI